MNLEIERKFLLGADTWRDEVFRTFHIRQGYLHRQPGLTVRIRIRDDQSFLNIKQRAGHSAVAREYEYEIPVSDAEALLTACGELVLTKKRHLVRHSDHLWEIDEFLGRHEGLIMAEVELEREDEPVDVPPWLGREVTGQPEYYNAHLVSDERYRTET